MNPIDENGAAARAGAEPEAPSKQAAPESEAERGEDAAGQEVPPEERIAQLEAETADLTDRLIRTAADMENLRKRSERDVADARRYAVAKFAGDMLVVGDNLQRALQAVSPEAREADPTLASFVEGVEMTAREMDRMLEKHGVERIAAAGERFDPHRHQAVFEAPDASLPAGTVLQVVQDGYMIGDRVLRAAMVGVSRGGPKPGAAEAGDGGASGRQEDERNGAS